MILNKPVRQGTKTLVGPFYKSEQGRQRSRHQLAKMAALTSTKSLWPRGEPYGCLATRGTHAPRQASNFPDLQVEVLPFVLGGSPIQSQVLLPFSLFICFCPFENPKCSTPPHPLAFWRGRGPLELHRSGQPYPLVSQNSSIFSLDECVRPFQLFV